ncbi:ORF6N domain-containing protein [Candidatus Saccharibacteria bacterium]|nr:ORF6N domain-containing protein [Candidatus Saccharibacteria bacterium]
MHEVGISTEPNIESSIYEIRGKQVMLDSDLARLYQVKTKALLQSVKRNMERFPKHFMFQLSDEEFLSLRSQFVTSKGSGGRRYNPYVFTEQGVSMLSSILHSETAIQVSIRIMDAFVTLRHYVSTNLLEQKYINDLVMEDHDKIKVLENSFQKFEEKRKISEIYFNGQIYDAYSKIQEIFSEAKEKLVIIDAYADKTILDIIKRLPINVTIITKANNLLTKQDIIKYNKQYNNLSVRYDNSFHDRYFILDGKTVYHCGASINRIGYKTFSINLIKDEEICQSLIKRLSRIIK